MDVAARKRLFERRRAERKRPRATRYYLDEYMKHLDASPHMREACALRALWSQCPIEIDPEERIVGMITVFEPLGFHYGGGTFIDEAARDALIEQNAYTPEECEALYAALREADRRRYHSAEDSVHTDAELRSIRATAATSTFFAGHMVPDYQTILTIGLDGYRAEIARGRAAHGPDARDFYDAMDVMLDAIVLYIERCAAQAQGEMAGVLRHIAHRPPETFHQAIQLVWMLHMLNGADSFGRFDGYLLPFFVDADEAYGLIVDCLVKVEQAGAIQNMTIGGVDRHGDDRFTELTMLVLRATRELGYKGPNLCLLVTPTMPEAVWAEAIRCIASGIGLPALYNNSIYVDALQKNGYPPEDAREFSLAGCSQVMIPGQCNFMNDIGMLNAMKVGEIALYDGYDPGTGVQVGIATGADFEDFDALYEALLQQLDFFIALEVSLNDRDIRYRAQREGYVMRSLFTRGCLDSAVHVMDGGARYNNVELEVIGITNLADHLYAIKQVVFEQGRATYAQLKRALLANWKGHEDLRALCKGAPKFGNGHRGVDALRAELTRVIYEKFNEAPGTLGGIYVPGEVIFTAHDWTGRATGATADGRGAGAVLADSAGASQGKDINGPTALMQSVLTLPVSEYLLTTAALNLGFLPATMKGTRSAERVKRLFEGFFLQGGMQLQVNVCDAETLIAAQADPESHKSLIVRVGGYSDYFVNLSKALQDEIIERTGYSA